MARIAGVNIPTQKRVVIALTYIHGIGRTKAREICVSVGIPDSRRVNDLTDSELTQIRESIDQNYQVEGDEHKTVDGSWMLPGPSASSWAASAWPTDAYECEDS